MKKDTIPDLVFNSFASLRSKLYSFSYSNHTKQKAKQKGVQHAPHYID